MKQKRDFPLDSGGSIICVWKLYSFSWCMRGEPGAAGWSFKSLKMRLILESRREKQRKSRFQEKRFKACLKPTLLLESGYRSHTFIYKGQFAPGFLSLENDKVLTARRSLDHSTICIGGKALTALQIKWLQSRREANCSLSAWCSEERYIYHLIYSSDSPQR